MYDIIGDVHGYADQLKKLLREMGYQLVSGCYRHPERKAVFVGDIINRGPKIKETITIVRNMVEAGAAYAILGNHELYAIIYYLKDSEGKQMKKQIQKYQLQINQTLSEFANNKAELKSHLKWFRTLPLFLDFGDIRVVHACWDDNNIRSIAEKITGDKISKEQLREVVLNGTPFSKIFWETVKGVDFQLPRNLLIYDDDGRPHRSFRMKWWENPEGKTFKDISLESRFELPAYTIPKEIVNNRASYEKNNPIVFFGHYSLVDMPRIFSDNLCCVDSGVSRSGNLLAYRWNGETKLMESNFVLVSC
jgi:diadenosine tetraphosphatase ApaH/serine/threonine PP2A family protein phosphatase